MLNASHPNTSPQTFLVVDDHAGFRRTVRDFLPGDARVIECADGRAAVQAYETHHPAWTLMDIDMPDMDGFAATRAIVTRFPGACVVILTQHDSADYREEARLAGACGFLRKDDLPRLLSLLEGAIEPGRTRGPLPPLQA